MLLMNGKEINNLIISGERFTRPYDNLIGKNMKIYSQGFSEKVIKAQGDDYNSYNGHTYFFIPRKYDNNGKVVPFQIVKITGWRYATTSKDWQGLWLEGDIYDNKDNFRGGAWIRVDDVEILENGDKK